MTKAPNRTARLAVNLSRKNIKWRAWNIRKYRSRRILKYPTKTEKGN